MSKLSVPAPIGFKVEGEIGVGKLKSSLHGSPTTTVRQHLISALANGTNLGQINKIVLVDSNGTERDNTTSLNYSINTGSNQATLTITGTINITASYTVARVRAYSGTNLYFDTSLSTTINVNNGDAASVTLTITISYSGTMTYGSITETGDATYPTHVLTYRIAQVLSGGTTASNLKVSAVYFELFYAGTDVETSKTVSTTNTVSSDGLSLTISCSWTADDNYEIFYIAVRLNDGSEGWAYTLHTSIEVPYGSTVSYTETVSA